MLTCAISMTGHNAGTDVYWGRGNGWAMLGLINALRYGDAAAVTGGVADPHRSEYIRIFNLFADRLLSLQGADGEKTGRGWGVSVFCLRGSILSPSSCPFSPSHVV